MPSNWRSATWGELASLEYGKAIRGYKNAVGPYRVYGTNGPIGWHHESLYSGPSVIVGRKGAYRGVHYAPGPFYAIDTAFYLKPKVEFDMRWAYYQLLTQDINGMDSGSAIPSTSRDEFYQLPVLVPPIAEQREIAAVLGSLDSRIELLLETSKSLEAISTNIFKSWFIDFDPVRAKAEGRDPEGMSADIATLFPSEFVDSELGPIPKGWTIACLKDQVTVERGLSYKGNGLCGPGEGIPMHNLNSIYEGGGYKYEGLKYYRGDYKTRHLVCAGDLVVTNTEQGHEHRLIGFPGVVPGRFPQGLYSHHLYKVVPVSAATVGREYIYHLLQAPAVRDQVIGCANGSTVNMLKIEGLQIPMFVCPTEEIAWVFEGISSDIRKKVECNYDQAEALIGLRDTLLPRLLSGNMSV